MSWVRTREPSDLMWVPQEAPGCWGPLFPVVKDLPATDRGPELIRHRQEEGFALSLAVCVPFLSGDLMECGRILHVRWVRPTSVFHFYLSLVTGSQVITG